MNLNQLTVPVQDVARSIGFYKTLGLRLIVEALPHYARFECPEGDATFSLHQVNTPEIREGIWVYFETAELDDQVRQLQEAGIEIEELPNDKSWLWREARLKDPDGNQIILFWAGEYRKNPPWRLSTKP
jgi:catechol 2,3-dioxygenase-like lactoylglutathione lyase family enzyme